MVKEYRAKIAEMGIEDLRSDDEIFSDVSNKINGMDTQLMLTAAVCKPTDMVDTIASMKMDENSDVYVTMNASSDGRARADSIYTHYTISKDIDCHTLPDGMTNEDRQALCARLCDDLIDFLPDGLRPNIVALSGRGLQLHFRHVNCAKGLGWIVEKTSDLIDEMISRFLNQHPEYSCFNLDDCMKTHFMHLARAPFTFNTKSGTWGQVRLVHEEVVDINVLMRRFYFAVHGVELPQFNRETRRAAEKAHKKSLKLRAHIAIYQDEKMERKTEHTRSTKRGFANLLNYRCSLIEYVVNRMPAHRGYRNKLLYNYLYAAIQCHKPETADEMARNLNSQFSEPLRESEVRSICAALKKNSFYQVGASFQNMKQYKKENWLSFFQSIPGFNKYYNEFVEMKKRHTEEKKRVVRHQRSMEKVTKKLDRDEQIRALAANGYTKTVIAAAVGVCRKTVYTVLNKVRVYAEKAMNLIVGAPQSVAAPI
jgi:hypothetical protein